MATLRLTMAVDANNTNIGDIYLVNGTDRLTATLAEEVQQELYTRFRFFQGEWFLDTTAGVPYIQTATTPVAILGNKIPYAIVAQIFRQVIVTCPGVRAILSFNLQQPVARQANLQFTCQLNDGQVLKSSDFAPFVIGNFVVGGQ